MKHSCLSVSLAAVLGLAGFAPGKAEAVEGVFDAANFAINTTIALKMHAVLDSLNNMGGGDTNYYNEQKFYQENNKYYNEQNHQFNQENHNYNVLNQKFNEENSYFNKEVYNHNVEVTNHNNRVTNHNIEVTNHNKQVAVYNEQNNYYCNIGTGGDGDGGLRVSGGDQHCIADGNPGEIIIPIPVRQYGVGKFGDHDTVDEYMSESRGVLADLAEYDKQRHTSVMDSNRVQANAVDQQARAFEDDSNRVIALAKASTADMGSRMQAVYTNQIAAAQTAEMLQMRALMLADQNAQVVRAQEVATRNARESAAESRLRAVPDLRTEAVRRW